VIRQPPSGRKKLKCAKSGKEIGENDASIIKAHLVDHWRIKSQQQRAREDWGGRDANEGPALVAGCQKEEREPQSGSAASKGSGAKARREYVGEKKGAV